MDTLAIFSLILSIANVISVSKADFFLDGELGGSVNRQGQSVFGRNYDHYDRDSRSSLGLGLDPTSFNGQNDFESEVKIQYYPGAQIHRDKKYDKHVDKNILWQEEKAKLEKQWALDPDSSPVPPTRKRRPTKYKKSRIFDIFRRTNDYMRHRDE